MKIKLVKKLGIKREKNWEIKLGKKLRKKLRIKKHVKKTHGKRVRQTISLVLRYFVNSHIKSVSSKNAAH